MCLYEYDALGRRTSKKTVIGITRFYYDGDSNRLLYETDGGGNLLARYIYGQKGQRVIMIKGSETYFYHYNHHGDVVTLTNSTGNIVAQYDYDAWGNHISTGLEGVVDNSYRYAGYRWDEETGMYFLNSRYYWPTVGRFISRDSFNGFIENPQSQNQYAYANGNPLKFIDPEGNVSVPAIINAVRSISGIGARQAAKVWSKTKTWLNRAKQESNKYQIDGPTLNNKYGEGRIFGVRSKQTGSNIFRLDYKKIKSDRPFLHYHLGESKTHYIVWPQPTKYEIDYWRSSGTQITYVGTDFDF